MVDELPLLSASEPRRDLGPEDRPSARRGAGAGRGGRSAPEGLGDRVSRELGRAGRFFADNIWSEIRSLVRITPIDHPEAMLVAPEQAFFLRENLKLRLLNARLALLAASSTPPRPTCSGRRARSSATSTAARSARRSPPSCCARSAQQARGAGVPRPDDTLRRARRRAAAAALTARRRCRCA